jgi:transposase
MNLPRLRGRVQRGERVHASAPGGHWQTTTMRSSSAWTARPRLLNIAGADDTDVFQSYVREVRCPTLRPGDLVVMTHLSLHKNAQPLELIAQVGAEVRFLPAHSPDLNPMEKRWSKVEQFLRSTEVRDWEKLQTAIAPERLQLVRLLWIQFYLIFSGQLLGYGEFWPVSSGSSPPPWLAG